MAMPLPPGPPAYGGMPGEMGGYGPMGMPRSPPKNKSTDVTYHRPGAYKLRRAQIPNMYPASSSSPVSVKLAAHVPFRTT